MIGDLAASRLTSHARQTRGCFRPEGDDASLSLDSKMDITDMPDFNHRILTRIRAFGFDVSISPLGRKITGSNLHNGTDEHKRMQIGLSGSTAVKCIVQSARMRN